VKQALKAVATAASAADAADAGGGGGGGPPSAATASAGPKATLAWEIVAGKDGGGGDSAKLTVKEVKKVGAIDLAVITLPAVKEVRSQRACVCAPSVRCAHVSFILSIYHAV